MEKFKTYKLAIQFYRKSNNLNLKGPMKNQFQRALLSIPLNLAEGSAKSSNRERRKFYEISFLKNLNDFLNIMLKHKEILLTKMHHAF